MLVEQWPLLQAAWCGLVGCWASDLAVAKAMHVMQLLYLEESFVQPTTGMVDC